VLYRVEFDEGIEALEYWRERRERLAWHRRAARREADAMVDVWERRLRRAVFADPDVPVAQRLQAGVLVLRTRGSIVRRRWLRRASVCAVAMSAAAGASFAAVLHMLF
jgi:hypothetical protein